MTMKQSVGTILVVDDNHDNLRLLRDLLTGQGYRVTVATGGEKALNSVQTEKPELILLDINMPGKSGYDVCKQLKEDLSTRNIPILFLSAYTDPADITKGFSIGGVDYITKPFHTEELLARVKTHLTLYAMQIEMEGLVAQRTTELEQVNAELRKSEDESRALLNATTESLILLDREGIIVDINETGAARLGHQPDELVGSCIYDLLPPELAQARKERLPEIFSTGQPVRFEDKRGDNCFDNQVYPIPGKERSDDRLAVFAHDITESRRTETTLKQERKRAQKYLDVAGVMMVAIDYNGKVMLINRKGSEILGYPQDEILGKNWFDHFIPKRINKQVKTIFQRLMIGDVDPVEYYENCIITKDGEERMIAWRNTILRDDDGSKIGTLSSGEDITERKSAEIALQRSYQMLAIAEKTAGMGSWEWDLVSNKLTYSENALQICGAALEKLGDNFIKVVHPDDVSTVNKNIEEMLSEKKPRMLEFRIVRPDGTTRIIEGTNQIRFNDHGDIIKLIGHIHDITEQKQAEVALKQSEDKYRTLFEKMNEGFALYEVMVDEDGTPFDYRFLEVNPAFESMTGLSNVSVVGRTARDLLSGIDYDPANWISRYSNVALTGEEITFEEYSQPFKRWYQINCFSPRTGQFAAVFKDITERKSAEEEIRTSLKEKEILLRELYHRTKNNIQVIISMLRLRARKDDHPRVKEIFLEMENKMLSMALAHQKLYESRDLSHLDLKEYIDGLIHVLKKSLLTSTDCIDIELEGDNIEVVLDTAIPCGIIVNEMVTNSIKHAFHGDQGGRIKIRLNHQHGDKIVLKISDNGVGLPQQFDIKRDGGLGFRTVIDLVEYQLGGDIQFHDNNGLGCTIELRNELHTMTRIDE